MGNTPASAMTSTVTAGAKNVMKDVGLTNGNNNKDNANDKKKEEQEQQLDEAKQRRNQERALREQEREATYRSKQQDHARKKQLLKERWIQSKEKCKDNGKSY